MTQRGAQINQDKLCCSICLDLLKDPVTIPCGHNYCMNCIQIHWDEEDRKNIHSCPQCRQTFAPRTALGKNTMLAELVEDLKKTGQTAPATHRYAGPEDVSCDVCTERKLKAVKSCLQCLVSYCEQHLQPHYESPAFRKHKLVDPSQKLQDNICSHHNEAMKIFCRTDQQCICYLCSMDEHRGHDTVSAAKEMSEKQRELEVCQEKIQRRIKDQDKHMRVLQQKMKAISQSADKAVRDSEMIFTELICLLEKIRSDVKQQIRSKQKKEVSRLTEIQEKLKQETVDLQQKKSELEQLCHMQDYITFLQKYPSQPSLTFSEKPPSISIHPLCNFDDVTASLSKIREKMQDILKGQWTKLSATVSECDQSQREHTTREEFLKYSQHITLVPNTESKILISASKKKASTTQTQNVCMKVVMLAQLGSPERRKMSHFCVLSKESLTGRCYWEVTWSGTVAVAVTNTNRLPVYGFGNDNTSWALYSIGDKFEFRHDNIRTHISTCQSSTIGVYLDHSAGTLSFYSVSDDMTLLHRVQATFTQPLYAGFFVGYGLSVVELKKTAVIR
ncbi:tripartite motif-containing protein 16-like [Pundamilia nyererei]|uniref:Tripartite motif-containing protein 16-like n=1 Tax=Pundamilia nyererei TaxID=303518 RepID=A0A9Y6M3I6_9CICH|nr:PREDICTED: tripartite motif-containing protein 16-like [Pundamilia nyererei]